MGLLKKMFLKKYKISRSFKRLFYSPDGELTEDAKIVLEYLRDVCCAKGELQADGKPYLYGEDGLHTAHFLIGKRHVMDVIVANLAIDDVKIFNLASSLDNEEETFSQDINII